MLKGEGSRPGGEHGSTWATSLLDPLSASFDPLFYGLSMANESNCVGYPVKFEEDPVRCIILGLTLQL